VPSSRPPRQLALLFSEHFTDCTTTIVVKLRHQQGPITSNKKRALPFARHRHVEGPHRDANLNTTLIVSSSLLLSVCSCFGRIAVVAILPCK
jgi:hypothetical protein